jgi:hypothetical protein
MSKPVGKRIQFFICDLRLSEEWHHRNAMTHEILNRRRSEIRAAAKRRRFRSFVLGRKSLCSRMPRSLVMTWRTPVLEYLRSVTSEAFVIRVDFRAPRGHQNAAESEGHVAHLAGPRR